MVLLGTFKLELEELLEAIHFWTELAVQLVATDSAQVVTTAFEEGILEVVASRLCRWRLTGASTLVDLDERLFLGRREFAILFPLPFEEVEVIDEFVEETRSVLLVKAKCPKQHEEAEATLACNTSARGDVLARLLLDIEFDPFAAVGVNGAGDELMLGEVTQAVALARLEDDARRADELTYDHTLGAVDHEGAATVIIGKSPMKTVCSLISPVLEFMKRARTKIGAL